MKAFRTTVALSLFLSSAALGCSNDFDPGSRVTSLRVLAVHADQPFAAPGEKVSLDTLAFDPNAGSRPVTWAWATCVNPAASSVVACLAKTADDAARTGAPLGLSMGTDLQTFSFVV